MSVNSLAVWSLSANELLVMICTSQSSGELEMMAQKRKERCMAEREKMD